VPKRLARDHGLPRRIGRIFRDEEELAASPHLSKDIQDALRRSTHLIIVCSPRARDSKWVNAEVDFFRSLGRSEKILTLLIEGEPATSFPPSLFEIRPSSAQERFLNPRNRWLRMFGPCRMKGAALGSAWPVSGYWRRFLVASLMNFVDASRNVAFAPSGGLGRDCQPPWLRS